MIVRMEREDKRGEGLALFVRDNKIFQEILVDSPFK